MNRVILALMAAIIVAWIGLEIAALGSPMARNGIALGALAVTWWAMWRLGRRAQD